MAQFAQNTDIPPAQAGPISDEILDRMVQVAADLENNTMTPEGGALLLIGLHPALNELVKRRQIMRLVQDACHPGNVVYLTDQP